MPAITMGVGTAAALVGKTAAGAKLAGLGAALAGLNPFSLGGAMKLGTGLAAGGFLMGLPQAVEDNIISQGKVNGRFQTGPISSILDVLDGEGSRFSQSALQTKADKIVTGSDTAIGAAELGFRAPKPGESQSGYDTAYATWKGKTKGSRAFAEPMTQYLLSQDRARVDRQFSQDNRAMDLQQMQIQGGLDNNALAMRIAQEGNKERMFYHAQDLESKRENDRYRTTAGLIGGLSALGAAFAL